MQLIGDPTLKIAEDSLQPIKPNTPEGSDSGRINNEYTYSALTMDPEGEEIFYLFDWGDGEYSEWIGPVMSGVKVVANHEWTSKGNYNIKVIARDIHGVRSEWSDPLPVSIPKNKDSLGIIIQNFIERILNQFSFFQLFYIF